MANNELKIKNKLGDDLFRKVIASILLAQAQVVRTLGLPFGGNFISFNGDTIIWSLSGRTISGPEKKKVLMRKDLKDIKAQAILNLRRGQKISGKDLRQLEIVPGKGDTIIIKASTKSYSKYIAPEKGPTSKKELHKSGGAIEIRKKIGPIKWILNLLTSAKNFILKPFKK